MGIAYVAMKLNRQAVPPCVMQDGNFFKKLKICDIFFLFYRLICEIKFDLSRGEVYEQSFC